MIKFTTLSVFLDFVVMAVRVDPPLALQTQFWALIHLFLERCSLAKRVNDLLPEGPIV